MMPVYEAIFEDLESPTFFVLCGLASGTKVLNRIMDERPSYQQLQQGMFDQQVRQMVEGRLHRVLQEPHDSRYMHPRHFAIVAYRRLLHGDNNEQAVQV